jgi:hypothetical protein
MSRELIESIAHELIAQKKKPPDATDIGDLDSALTEVRKLRSLCNSITSEVIGDVLLYRRNIGEFHSTPIKDNISFFTKEELKIFPEELKGKTGNVDREPESLARQVELPLTRKLKVTT